MSFILDHPIGRRRPMRCLGRFAGWQVRSRLSNGPHRVGYVGRTHFLARHGEAGVSGNIYVGLHEFADMAFVAHLLRPGDLFVDVGANAGSYTLLAAGWSGARVLAIEPAPDAFGRLEANVASNALAGSVELHRVAIGCSDGTVTFTTDSDATNHIAVDRSSTAATIEVPLCRLDTLVGGRPAHMLKIDVEGFERDVLEGARSTLACPDLLALLVEISTNDRGYDRSSIALLESTGFTPCRYDPWRRVLTADPGPLPGNVLFVRDVAAVETRLRAARSSPVLGELV